MNNRFWYTYVYVDTRTGIPFYVGKGASKRVDDLSGRSLEFKERFAEILNDDFVPHVRIHYHDTEELARYYEHLLIHKYGRADLGKGPLLNKVGGLRDWQKIPPGAIVS